MPPPPYHHLLLLGAGFSRNWGGPLAYEMFPRLLSSRAVSPELREFMLSNRRQGFEGILGMLQASQAGMAEPDMRLMRFEEALVDVFMDLHSAYSRISFNWNSDMERTVTQFLTRFDAIFTLNQDTLLELHYLNDNVCLASPDRRWDGWSIPGMAKRPGSQGYLMPTSEPPALSPRLQPYIKLHGSINWRKAPNSNLLVVGDNKPTTIAKEPILAWGKKTFDLLPVSHTSAD